MWKPGASESAGHSHRITVSSLHYIYIEPVGARSSPFSMRLPSAVDALVTEEARRTRRSKGAVVAALADGP